VYIKRVCGMCKTEASDAFVAYKGRAHKPKAGAAVVKSMAKANGYRMDTESTIRRTILRPKTNRRQILLAIFFSS